MIFSLTYIEVLWSTSREKYSYMLVQTNAAHLLQRGLHTHACRHTGCLQKNGAVSKVNKKIISHLTRAKLTPSVAATVQVSHALPVIRFSCLMRGRGASFQDGVAAGKDFLCAPF